MIHTQELFIESLDLEKHPMRTVSKKKRITYMTFLQFIVDTVIAHKKRSPLTNTHETYISYTAAVLSKYIRLSVYSKYITARLNNYYSAFHVDANDTALNFSLVHEQIDMPFLYSTGQRTTRLCLACDAYLVLEDPELVSEAFALMSNYLSKRQRAELKEFAEVLCDETRDIAKFKRAEYLVTQCRKNIAHLQLKEKHILVTANMSAGKSTLINAIIGKRVARTSQEVCTGNACYIWNKPFEDNNVHLMTSSLNLHADTEALSDYTWDGIIAMAAYFSSVYPHRGRIRIVDTPGVNAALYKKHSEITHSVLSEQSYDKILYIFSPTNLGTDAELAHLRWMASHVEHSKIVFVLNKIDEYRAGHDNIRDSIASLRQELTQLGFTDPVICPISAYCAFLQKLKKNGAVMTEDEEDEYEMLQRRFNKEFYDLSGYYPDALPDAADSEEILEWKRSGLYGFEKILYGGETL